MRWYNMLESDSLTMLFFGVKRNVWSERRLKSALSRMLEAIISTGCEAVST